MVQTFLKAVLVLKMATFKKFEEIVSWQKARELNNKLRLCIKKNAFDRNYKFVNQIMASCGSIMDNIAEGFERNGNREFIQYLYISKGSCGEFRSQLYRALDSNYLIQSEFDELYKLSFEISVLIQKLIHYLQSSSLKGAKYKHLP